MDIQEKTQRRFFSGKWSKLITISFEASATNLSRFAHRVLTEVVPDEVYTKGTLKNLKGRDKQNLLLEKISRDQKPSGEELIFIETTDRQSNDREQISFISHTNFDRFEGTHHIFHHTTPQRVNFPHHALNPRLLGFIAPLQIETFRLGLERFTSVYTTLSFGYTPTVTEQLLIDVANGQGKIQISSEILTSEDEMPFAESGLAAKVIEIAKITYSI